MEQTTHGSAKCTNQRNGMIKELTALTLMTALALPVAAQPGHGRRPSSPAVPHSSHHHDDHNLYYSVRLGLTLGRVPSDQASLDGSQFQLGVNAGGAVGLQVVRGVPIYVEAGLLYTQKGGKADVDYREGEGTGSRKMTFGLGYVEMPIVAKYFVPIGYDATLQPFVGGYLAYGVGGNVKDFGMEKEYASFSDNYFKRFDGGLRAGFALQFQMVYIEAAYDLGLANVGRNSFGATKTGTLSVQLGLAF